MYEKIVNLIEKYQTIIIHRHFNPDGDAMGSQLGLRSLLKVNYPKKTVYAVGDVNTFRFLGDVDDISDEVYKGALVIVVDVAISRLVSDDRYKLADHVLVIDHHLNPSDIADTEFNDSSSIATAQIIADIAIQYEWQITKEAATQLFCGLVTDSGRFKYPGTTAKSFEIAAVLLHKGANREFVYDRLYTEQMNFKKLRGYFINNFKVYGDKIAYMLNDTTVKDQFNATTFTVSRAMVNQMADISGIEAWTNFTEEDNGDIYVELRSKRIPIVEVAKKYQGGGHALACGCTITDFETAELILQDIIEVIEGSNLNG